MQEKYYAKLIAQNLEMKVRLKKTENLLKKEKLKNFSWTLCEKKLINGHWYLKGSDVLMSN